MENQELLALFIVQVTFFIIVVKKLRTHATMPLARWLLKRGQVKWAMRVKSWAPRGRCH